MFYEGKGHEQGAVMLHLWLNCARTTKHSPMLCFTAPRMGKSESQMDIMEKSTKPRKHRWTVVEIGLSVIVLLMSCALAGLIVLYTSALRGGKTRPISAANQSSFIQVLMKTLQKNTKHAQDLCRILRKKAHS